MPIQNLNLTRLMHRFYIATYFGRNIFEDKPKLKQRRRQCPN